MKYLNKDSTAHLCASTEDRSWHVLSKDKLKLEFNLPQNLPNKLNYGPVAIFHYIDGKFLILLWPKELQEVLTACNI
jgi:hypothetical protein